jgi:hypothetical protein
MYRPLLLSSFVINHAWSGGRGWSWHLVNMALHAWVSILAVQLARQQLQRAVRLQPGNEAARRALQAARGEG